MPFTPFANSYIADYIACAVVPPIGVSALRFYMALFATPLNEDGSGGTEISSNFINSLAPGERRFIATIHFRQGQASSSTNISLGQVVLDATIQGIGIFDAPTIGGGNCWVAQTLDPFVNVTAGSFPTLVIPQFVARCELYDNIFDSG
jgi:hypothetical protein